MKGFFLTGSIISTVLILILAFENIGTVCQGFMFLFAALPAGTSSFFIIAGLSMLGGITGIFYTGLVLQLLHPANKDEEGDQ